MSWLGERRLDILEAWLVKSSRIGRTFSPSGIRQRLLDEQMRILNADEAARVAQIALWEGVPSSQQPGICAAPTQPLPLQENKSR